MHKGMVQRDFDVQLAGDILTCSATDRPPQRPISPESRVVIQLTLGSPMRAE